MVYRRLYWLRPRFDQVARRSPRIAAELFDTRVNVGRRLRRPSPARAHGA
ncbi:glycosyl hydrolase 108 family protein [Sphingomonas sediminicola]